VKAASWIYAAPSGVTLGIESRHSARSFLLSDIISAGDGMFTVSNVATRWPLLKGDRRIYNFEGNQIESRVE